MSRPTNLVPLLNVADVGMSIEFYEELGFEVKQKIEADGALVWADLEHAGGGTLMLNAKDIIAPGERAARAHYSDTVFYLTYPSAREMHGRLSGRGMDVTEVEKQPYGIEEFYVRDPDGYEIAIGSPLV
ncbi:MAG: VOC family protein [Parvibaculaceae bacterium]|nr:VOC family protein [Parvibaculaceae bacterium]